VRPILVRLNSYRVLCIPRLNSIKCSEMKDLGLHPSPGRRVIVQYLYYIRYIRLARVLMKFSVVKCSIMYCSSKT